MFERTFIADSYSCIKGRGTHYGIRRLESHIRKESQNYKESCYVLKMDIRGYFMHIDRVKLLELCLDTINRMQMHRIGKYRSEHWCEKVDIEFVRYLTRQIVMQDCTLNCLLKCRHYGRYVDDFYIVSSDCAWLHSVIPKVRRFLAEELGLILHEGKLRIDSVRQGVELLFSRHVEMFA